jgi:hypothetical protein
MIIRHINSRGFMRTYLYIATLTTLTLLASCGKKDSNKGDEGQQPLQLTATEQIIGEWSGVYRGLEGGQPSSDAYMVNLSFGSDGKFSLSNPNDASAIVRGSWSEFQGKSLLLSISESTIPKIGVASTLIEVAYDLVGTQLKFGNLSFEVKIAKKQVSNPTEPTNATLIGKWACDSSQQRISAVEFKEGSEYRLSTQGRGERIFISKGSVEVDSDKSLRLSIAQSSERVAQGSIFKFAISGPSATLSFVRGDGKVVYLGTCKK